MVQERPNRTLSAAAASVLREEILTGRLAPGAHIPLTETAERLEMSVIPVREALQTLTSQGLVEQRPHRGYRVQAANLADLEDTYRLRLVLDPMAVGLAVPRLDVADLEQLEGSLTWLTQAQQRDDWEAHRRHHRAFHFGIYANAGSPWLTRFLQMLWDGSERYQRLSTKHRGTLPERVREHQLILEACSARDPAEASRRMYEHLSTTYESVRRHAVTASAHNRQ